MNARLKGHCPGTGSQSLNTFQFNECAIKSEPSGHTIVDLPSFQFNECAIKSFTPHLYSVAKTISIQ